MPLPSKIRSFLSAVTKRLPRIHLDVLQWPLFILGLCFLFFILGSVSAYFNWTPYQTVRDAIDGGMAWNAQQKRVRERKPPVLSVEDAVKKPILPKWEKNKTFNGPTLIIARFSTTAYLVDMKGKVLHSWSLPFNKAWPEKPPHVAHPVDPQLIYFEGAHLLPNGDLIVQYTGLTDTPWGYGVARMDKNSKLIWKYSGNAHHNIDYSEETGETYVLTHSFVKIPPNGFKNLQYPLLADEVVVLSPKGKEKLKFSLLEAFRNSGYEHYLQQYQAVYDAPWDLMHANSIQRLNQDMAAQFPMFKPGQLLISLRNFSLLIVVDPDSKKVVWAVKGPWLYQHDAQFLSNGHILLLDNLGCNVQDRFCSRVLEYDPKTAKIAWSYPDLFKNPDAPKFLDMVLGHVQRLPNGNTLVLQPYDGNTAEITPDGQIVWRYRLLQHYGNDLKTEQDFITKNNQLKASPYAKAGQQKKFKAINSDYERVPSAKNYIDIGFPHVFLKNISFHLSNVLIYSHRFSMDDLPFLKEETADTPPKAVSKDDTPKPDSKPDKPQNKPKAP